MIRYLNKNKEAGLKESVEQFQIDFNKDTYKKIHEDILSDISQIRTKKKHVMKKLESNINTFTDKNNSLIVKNEYLIKAFKNGSRKNSIERESNNRKLAEILDENEMQKVNLKSLNSMAGRKQQFTFYLESD